MKSVYIIIDASSYINLSSFEYRFGDLLSTLSKEVTLRYSSTVNQEVARHWKKKLPDNLERSAKIHYPKQYEIEEYEEILFDKVTLGTQNKGEKHNFSIALDLFLNQKKSNLVFLIDDEMALKGILQEARKTFPIIKIWNSFDVVLYLFLLKKNTFPIEVAKRAIRQIYKQTLPTIPPEGRLSETFKDKMRKKEKSLTNYLKYLNRIQKLHRGY